MRFTYGFTSAAMANEAELDASTRARMFQGCDWSGRLPPKQVLRLRLGGRTPLGEQQLVLLRKPTVIEAVSIQFTHGLILAILNIYQQVFPSTVSNLFF